MSDESKNELSPLAAFLYGLIGRVAGLVLFIALMMLVGAALAGQ